MPSSAVETQTEDLKAFERRLIDIQSHFNRSAGYWRLIFTIVCCLTAFSAYFFITDKLYTVHQNLDPYDEVKADDHTEEEPLTATEELKPDITGAIMNRPVVTSMRVLGVDLTKRSSLARFLYLSFLVFVLFLGYAYLQELFFSHPSFRPYGWYLTLVQFFCYTLFGAIDCLLFSGNPLKNLHIPLKTYCFFAFLQVATMGLSNQSVGYLNYPTQVMFKSAKLLPVLVGSVFVQQKRPQIAEWLAAFCMSVGIALFLLADVQLQLPIFHPFGVLLISLALCADALIGNVQEKAMEKYAAPPSEILLFTYGIGSIYIVFGLFISGFLFSSLKFGAENFIVAHGIAFGMSATGFLGQLAVLGLVRFFGAYIAATVTTARKGMTILLSFVLFTKPFSFQYVVGFLIFSSGAYVQINAKILSEKFTKFITSFGGRKTVVPQVEV